MFRVGESTPDGHQMAKGAFRVDESDIFIKTSVSRRRERKGRPRDSQRLFRVDENDILY